MDPSEDHSAVAAACAPAERSGFEQGHAHPALRQHARRGEAAESSANDGDVHLVGQGSGRAGGRLRHRAHPVVLFLYAHGSAVQILASVAESGKPEGKAGGAPVSEPSANQPVAKAFHTPLLNFVAKCSWAIHKVVFSTA